MDYRWAFLLLLGVAGCTATTIPTNPQLPFAQEQALCERFAQLHNAGDSGASALLGPAPEVPSEPITEAEATRLDAEFLLRRPLKITEVRFSRANTAKDGPPRFILVMKGRCASEELRVLDKDRVNRVQMTFVDPDVIAEVRDGKLFAIKSRIHVD